METKERSLLFALSWIRSLATRPIRSDAYDPGEAGKTAVLFPFGKTQWWLWAWTACAI